MKLKNGTNKTERRKNLEGKIEGLHENSLLTKRHAKILHELRFLGNKSAHEFDKPTKNELLVAIEIIEHTLENMYELDEKLSDLQFNKRQRK